MFKPSGQLCPAHLQKSPFLQKVLLKYVNYALFVIIISVSVNIQKTVHLLYLQKYQSESNTLGLSKWAKLLHVSQGILSNTV